MKKIFFLFTIYFLLFTTASAQSVDLLWQGETYTPPFYQGRSLWSTQSKITIVAMPNGLGSATGLNFRWIKNGTVLGNSSGVGRNTISFTDSILSKAMWVAVEIVSGNEEVLARNTITLAPLAPVAAVYENNPLYGFMFHKEVPATYNLKEKEITFTAFPYFFNANTRTSNNLSYEWKTNNGGAETRDSVTYRTPDGASGSSEVSLHINNRSEITQDASRKFLVKFGE